MREILFNLPELCYPVGMSEMRIGFIGLGVMGKSMAGHLLACGYPLTVYTRTASKAAELVEKGAEWGDSAGQVARSSNVIITIVGYPADVEDIYLGEDGIIGNASAGSLLVDMTTSSPALAKRIHKAAAERGVLALDAPVSGGDLGARNASLSIMVGGDIDAFKMALPVLGVIGKNIVYQGPAGSGQYTKMCNQIAIAPGMLGLCEALCYAKAAGLDPETVLKSIASGAAGSWSLSNLAPRILKGDFEPGFYVKHFIKDMGIAIQSAGEMGLDLPGLKLAREMYDKLDGRGGGDLGTQGLYKLYQEN